MDYQKIRALHYKQQRISGIQVNANIDEWIKSPYSTFKSRIYIEGSALIVYLIQNIPIHPNHITILYILLSFFSFFFLISNIKILMIIGLIIFIFQPILDWADGLLARIKRQTSLLGHMLDAWGANVYFYLLITSVGIYLFNSTNKIYFLYLTIFSIFIKLVDFRIFIFQQLFYENKKKKLDKYQSLQKTKIIFYFLKNFMDSRSRTTDALILTIIFEIIYEKIFLSDIFFYLYIFKFILVFFGYLYYYIDNKIFFKNIR